MSFYENLMASSSSSLGEKMAPKLVIFKFQGVPPAKSMFHDDNSEIKDTELGHTYLGEFLKICNKPTKKFSMVFSLIHSGLVKVASHLVSVQSSELIMKLSKHFVPKERVIQYLKQ